MNELEERYLELYSFQKINDMKKVAKKKNISIDKAKEMYTSYTDYLAEELFVNVETIKKLNQKLHKKISKIQKIYERFDENRQVGFDKNFNKFYNWYITQKKKQNNCCYYCKISENGLKELFDKGILKSKKFTATFHIERLDSEKNYIADNMVFACSLCNNAKSDMISENDFKDYFANPMYQYLQSKMNLLKKSS